MLNKVQLIGRVGADPELKFLPSGDAVANFTMATSEKYTDKNGEKQDATEWHRITCFRRLAEICGEYLKKGALIYVEGKIKTTKYQDKTTGADRYSTDIIIDKMKMLGGKADSVDAADTAPIGKTPQKQSRPASMTAEKTFDFDDEIPF